MLSLFFTVPLKTLLLTVCLIKITPNINAALKLQRNLSKKWLLILGDYLIIYYLSHYLSHIIIINLSSKLHLICTVVVN